MTPDSHPSIEPQTASLYSTPEGAAVLPSPQQSVAPSRSTHKVQPNSQVLWAKRIGIGLGAAVVLAAGISYGAYTSWAGSGNIASGVNIQGEPVGGLSRAEAKRRLEKRFGRLFVNVETPARSYRVSLSELGGVPKFDAAVYAAYRYGREGATLANVVRVWKARGAEHRLALPVEWNKTDLRRKMWLIATQYNQPAQDAKLTVTDEGVQVIAEREGRKLNVGETLAQLQKKYYVGMPTVAATTIEAKPRVVAASLAGSDVKLGEYTTRFDRGLSGRTRNIRVASAEVDGKILMPGEAFSFNETTGRRTWAKGYRMAHIFETKPGEDKAEVVDGLAGGVCQVSSTLYNAVRKANQKAGRRIKIVERNYHSLPVSYVPTGLDATVAWPSKDFRFRNTFEHPIYLRSKVRGSRLIISVWGRVSGNTDAITVDPDQLDRRAENLEEETPDS
ncbi:MAG TPA: VanW family protein [Abditibacteriaceae bacterium]|jgi:vancomycin resistance protein YoaR